MILISPEFGKYSDEEKKQMENTSKHNEGAHSK